MQVIKYVFQPHGDERGQLVALEEERDIPFHIRRVYYMYDTGEGVVRGGHAHKALEQILVCIHGSCKVRLDNGREQKVVPLEAPYEGLYVGSSMWREMYDFSPDAVLMVLASAASADGVESSTPLQRSASRNSHDDSSARMRPCRLVSTWKV